MKRKLAKTQGKICGCLRVFAGTYEYHWTSAKIFSIHYIPFTDMFSMGKTVCKNWYEPSCMKGNSWHNSALVSSEYSMVKWFY